MLSAALRRASVAPFRSVRRPSAAPTSILTCPAASRHAQLGLAHGLAGPLVLLALTTRAGYTVDGQHAALDASGAIGWPGLCRRLRAVQPSRLVPSLTPR
uniref:Uncharacterized protein SAMT0040 n=1 Tax=Streptomyces ambofaciens (strain ATCC 23877 / 3486 / DSM 40053 / JCM 4204 / NBRC 12836 / NRRL B-2516) TaxID=278992 RepID=Q1RR45_STRA7|nr:conserved hypothetical protein [Streptomyces ambofaciens ATCC 23877]CAI78243.1 conserved hypothetical protein [Streptomyces ambofaciens ATCC 23877]CAJ87750.1 conserved hypothetical protein [Streptomyces ambofaciens ATCC 23877]CAJ89028.1 conserved hypothetical protein [Streptomyces ambofaciens ATCC 23877]